MNANIFEILGNALDTGCISVVDDETIMLSLSHDFCNQRIRELADDEEAAIFIDKITYQAYILISSSEKSEQIELENRLDNTYYRVICHLLTC